MTWRYNWIIDMDQSYINMRTKKRYPFDANPNLTVWSARLVFSYDDGAIPIGKMKPRVQNAIEKYGYEYIRVDYDKEVRVIFAESE